MALRDWFIKDLPWKLFSLTLAVAIWATVKTLSSESTAGTDPLRDWDVHTFANLPVLVVSAAADVREFKVNPDTVEVTVRSRPEIIAALQAKEIHVTVDLTEVEAARDLRKRVDVSTPPGVTFIRVNPPQVDVVVPPRHSPHP